MCVRVCLSRTPSCLESQRKFSLPQFFAASWALLISCHVSNNGNTGSEKIESIASLASETCIRLHTFRRPLCPNQESKERMCTVQLSFYSLLSFAILNALPLCEEAPLLHIFLRLVLVLYLPGIKLTSLSVTLKTMIIHQATSANKSLIKIYCAHTFTLTS